MIISPETLTCITVLGIVTNSAGLGINTLNINLLPPATTSLNEQPKVGWFNQLIDHFENSSGMWRQRFYYSGKFYKQGGPVFLVIGGEVALKPADIGQSHVTEMAEQNNAYIFGLEHRYYGLSFPNGILNIKLSFEYLSSAQALADLAYFVENVAHLKEFEQLRGARWLAHGCSYPGMLAAWLRAEYPHLVYAAVSSSAPVLAKLDFTEYNAVVARVLRETKEGCLDNIEKASYKIRELQRSNDSSDLEALFPDALGDPVTLINKLIAGFAQSNLQLDDTGRPIQNVCSFMTNEVLGSPLKRYSALWKNIKDSRDKLAGNSLQSIPWRYQGCTEFGYQRSMNKNSFPFSDRSLWIDILGQCFIFGLWYNKLSIQASVDKTNKKYGGKQPNVSNVVFVNGEDDPWSPLGITSNPPEGDNYVIVIPGEPHCADFLHSTQYDSPELTKARKQIQGLVKKWSNSTNKCPVSIPLIGNWFNC